MTKTLQNCLARCTVPVREDGTIVHWKRYHVVGKRVSKTNVLTREERRAYVESRCNVIQGVKAIKDGRGVRLAEALRLFNKGAYNVDAQSLGAARRLYAERTKTAERWVL